MNLKRTFIFFALIPVFMPVFADNGQTGPAAFDPEKIYGGIKNIAPTDSVKILAENIGKADLKESYEKQKTAYFNRYIATGMDAFKYAQWDLDHYDPSSPAPIKTRMDGADDRFATQHDPGYPYDYGLHLQQEIAHALKYEKRLAYIAEKEGFGPAANKNVLNEYFNFLMYLARRKDIGGAKSFERNLFAMKQLLALMKDESLSRQLGAERSAQIISLFRENASVKKCDDTVMGYNRKQILLLPLLYLAGQKSDDYTVSEKTGQSTADIMDNLGKSALSIYKDFGFENGSMTCRLKGVAIYDLAVLGKMNSEQIIAEILNGNEPEKVAFGRNLALLDALEIAVPDAAARAEKLRFIISSLINAQKKYEESHFIKIPQDYTIKNYLTIEEALMRLSLDRDSSRSYLKTLTAADPADKTRADFSTVSAVNAAIYFAENTTKDFRSKYNKETFEALDYYEQNNKAPSWITKADMDELLLIKQKLAFWYHAIDAGRLGCSANQIASVKGSIAESYKYLSNKTKAVVKFRLETYPDKPSAQVTIDTKAGTSVRHAVADEIEKLPEIIINIVVFSAIFA